MVAPFAAAIVATTISLCTAPVGLVTATEAAAAVLFVDDRYATAIYALHVSEDYVRCECGCDTFTGT